VWLGQHNKLDISVNTNYLERPRIHDRDLYAFQNCRGQGLGFEGAASSSALLLSSLELSDTQAYTREWGLTNRDAIDLQYWDAVHVRVMLPCRWV